MPLYQACQPSMLSRNQGRAVDARRRNKFTQPAATGDLRDIGRFLERVKRFLLSAIDPSAG